MTSKCFPLSLVLAACSPYDMQQGEFIAGPVDAANFPLAYKGTGGDTSVNGYRAGAGKFTEIAAFINHSPAGYYSFPFTTRQLGASDTLQLVAYPDKDPKTPIAYAFDPEPPSPFPSFQRCTPPPNYTYNKRTDDMPLNEQDNIFIQLPFATERPGLASTFEYIPVVAEVAVTAGGLACQSLKSEKTLKKVLGVSPPTDRFLLWAIIDPSSGVYRVGEQSTLLLPDGTRNPNYSYGDTVQKWGWFGQYYLAYIDGGYVPVDFVSVTYGIPPSAHRVPKMKTQRLYIPLRFTPEGVSCGPSTARTTCQPGEVCANNLCQSCNGNRATPSDSCPMGQTCCPGLQTCINPGVNGTCSDLGKVGQGYDVLEFKRSDSNYSPVCEVRQYTADIGTPPRPRRLTELFTSATDIPQTPAPAVPTPESGIPRYSFCPQVD